MPVSIYIFQNGLSDIARGDPFIVASGLVASQDGLLRTRGEYAIAHKLLDEVLEYFLGGGFKHLFYPYLGKISNLTNIFQMG